MPCEYEAFYPFLSPSPDVSCLTEHHTMTLFTTQDDGGIQPAD